MISVTSISALTDNYIWVISSNSQAGVTIVDPGDARPVINHLEKHGLKLNGILVTHHHADHIGGIPELIQHYGNIPIYGPANESIATINHPLTDNLNFNLPDTDIMVKVIFVPGHTLGHLAYLIENHLFCGDTLFSVGCGRLFEGSPSQMVHSLAKFKSLASNTLVYPAHEYTLSNIAFALNFEANNQILINYKTWCEDKRRQKQPTLPTNIGLEKQINPFLRISDPQIQQQLSIITKTNNEVMNFALLRELKDKF